MILRSQVVSGIAGILATALMLVCIAYAQVTEQEIFSFKGYSGFVPLS